MPKMKAAVSVKQMSAIDALGGYSPGPDLVKALKEEIPLDGGLDNLEVLYKDWEPTADGKRLRLRGGIRTSTMLKLMEFVHPKVKDGGPGSGPIGISVTVNSFAEDGKGEKVVMMNQPKVNKGGSGPTVEVREV